MNVYRYLLCTLVMRVSLAFLMVHYFHKTYETHSCTLHDPVIPLAASETGLE